MKKIYSVLDLQPVVDHYSLGTIQQLDLFTSGTDNSNYHLKTGTGEYALRVYDGMNLTPDNIELEIKVMKTSYASGVKTPHVLPASDGSYWKKIDAFHMIIMDFIPGENMKKKRLSDELARQIGEEVGKMDTALGIFKDEGKTRRNYIFDFKNFLNNERSISLLPKQYDRQLFYYIIEEYKRNKEKIEALPKGIIHNDIVLHNFLVKGNELTGILDFGDIAFSPYVQNLAIAMAQCIFTYNWQPHQAGIFIRAYQKHHPLSREELDFLYLMTNTRFLTLIVEFNRWNVELGEDPVATEFVVNNYAFFQDFRALGREKFNSLIGL